MCGGDTPTIISRICHQVSCIIRNSMKAVDVIIRSVVYKGIRQSIRGPTKAWITPYKGSYRHIECVTFTC